MNIFLFIIYLGIINIVFGFLWKWIFVLPLAVLFTYLNTPQAMRWVKIFGLYLLISLTALLTLTALGETASVGKIIFYMAVTVFILAMTYANNLYQSKKEAMAQMDYDLIVTLQRESDFESKVFIAIPIFYVMFMFFPGLTSNGLVEWLLGAIGWIVDIPIIGWLIGIGGFFFLLSNMFYGLIAVGGIVATIVGKLKPKKS